MVSVIVAISITSIRIIPVESMITVFVHFAFLPHFGRISLLLSFTATAAVREGLCHLWVSEGKCNRFK